MWVTTEEEFPAKSVAVKVIVLTPGTSGIGADQFGAVNVGLPVTGPLSARDHVTVYTPEPPASVAVPATVLGVLPLLKLSGGELTTMTGGVLSLMIVRVVVPVFPAASVARTSRVFVPAARVNAPAEIDHAAG